MTAKATKPLTGRNVLMLLLAFFGAIVAVNGIFIFFAVTTFSGQTSRNPYAEGLRYNERIALAAAQSVNGLHHQTTLTHEELRLALTRANGESVEGLIVSARLDRPVSSDRDQEVALVEQSPGIYRAAVASPPGAWILTLTAQHEASGPPVYQSKERLWLKPQQ